MAIRIYRTYGPGTYVLSRDCRCLGTATESQLTPGSWLVDIRRRSGGFASLPLYHGSLLASLREVRKMAPVMGDA
jgi:hypothetical protein